MMMMMIIIIIIIIMMMMMMMMVGYIVMYNDVILYTYIIRNIGAGADLTGEKKYVLYSVVLMEWPEDAFMSSLFLHFLPLGMTKWLSSSFRLGLWSICMFIILTL